MNNKRNKYLAYRQGETFVGNADDVAKFVGCSPKTIRYAVDGSCINGSYVKIIAVTTIHYCIETNGKLYISDNVYDLQKIVWYAPQTIKTYCVNDFSTKNYRFYCLKKDVDIDIPKQRKFIK